MAKSPGAPGSLGRVQSGGLVCPVKVLGSLNVQEVRALFVFFSRGELVEVSFVDDLSGELTDFYHRLCLLETAVEDKLLRVGGLVLD